MQVTICDRCKQPIPAGRRFLSMSPSHFEGWSIMISISKGMALSDVCQPCGWSLLDALVGHKFKQLPLPLFENMPQTKVNESGEITGVEPISNYRPSAQVRKD